MSILADFVDKILSIGPERATEINGSVYTKTPMHRVKRPYEYLPVTLQFSTLKGLIDYAVSNIDGEPILSKETSVFHIVNYGQVDFVGDLNPRAENTRFVFASAKLVEKGYPFGQWVDIETFIIAMQSLFVQDETTGNILSIIGNIANSAVIENKDDGMSQSIHVKTGITTKENVKLTNPVTLRPFRTFREADQPESQFVFRIRKGKDGVELCLVDADGGAWKVQAVANIKSWLSYQLGQYECSHIVMG